MLMYNIEMDEFARIIEYCYHEKHERFVIRFLDGSSYALKVSDLPKKLQTKKPKWEDAKLSEDQTSLVVFAGNDERQIPAYIIHARGKAV